MVSVMSTFILAMVLHPHAFKKAQDEMDRVIGNDRLPEWEDRQELPYLNALIKEVYRCVLSTIASLPAADTDPGGTSLYH